MRLPRSSGVLLHPTSLPAGRLDEEAHRFVDWLAAAGQSWWQVLPLGPPDESASPYKAHSAFAGSPALLAEPDSPVSEEEAASFRSREAYWIDDWTAYAGQRALEDQVRFEREWRALRAYARARGVRIFGDLPIYVAGGSADHLAHPELFQQGVVAGVPPDDFSATGQLWGNPLYDWPALRRTGYRWWIERFRRTFAHVDLTRLDHFRGFVAYWAVPAGAPTAERGRWRRGPGPAPFRAAQAALGELPLVAEDLGVITPAVVRLRNELGFPGTLVAQLAFGGGRSSPHRLENHPAWSVVYTGTHDHDTAAAWWDSLSEREKRRTSLPGREPHWELIDFALSSRARVAVVPAQDVLGLGSEARMNTPGKAEDNWRWRLEPGALTPELATRLRAACERAGRLPRPSRDGTRRASP
ncbi:MAG: 4-alpha-glucanotransferase [Gaiellaceae bacterium]